MIREAAGDRLEGSYILDVGCGVGMYMRAFRQFTSHIFGVEVERERAREASAYGEVAQSPGETLPFPEGSFDLVLSHEVIEHAEDDQSLVTEMVRVLKPGGRLALFCPNRLYFFETHGHYWRGRYHFGNTPFINYLPDWLRDRLAPHVRAYTIGNLRALFAVLPVRIIVHTQIYPGYDNIVARRPTIGRLLRWGTYRLEQTPLRAFGLSHFLVVEKKKGKLSACPDPNPASEANRSKQQSHQRSHIGETVKPPG
jgi:SAM-dependent methyltransferase